MSILAGIILSLTAFVIPRGVHENKAQLALLQSKKLSGFNVKIQFFMLCSPDEVLKALLDEKMRSQWDFGLNTISVDNATNKIMLSYDGGMRADGSQREPLQEKVQISHLVFEQKFFIIEQINSPNIKPDEDGS